MKITNLKIDRFGVWENLELPLDPHRMTVLYGPNETGKTTIRRFIEEMLYGLTPPAISPDKSTRWGGSLNFLAQQDEYQITRHLDAHGQEHVSLLDPRDVPMSLERMSEYRGQQSREVFRSIFGVGLREIQELSTLQGDEVSRRLYGTSLGPIGRKILYSRQAINNSYNSLLGNDGLSGSLFELGKKKRVLEAQSQAIKDQKTRYLTLASDIQEYEDQLDSLKQRQQGLQQELHAYEYLQRVWPVWRRERMLTTELDKLPRGGRVSEKSLVKLNRYEQEIRQLDQKLTSLRREYDLLKVEFSKQKIPAHFWEHLGSIQSLVDQKQWLHDSERRISDLQSDQSLQELELREKISLLGQNWNINRLIKVDTSPDANFRLVQGARRYQVALGRRARFRRKYQKFSDQVHQQQVRLQEDLKRLRIESIEKTMPLVQQRIDKLDERSRLRQLEAELAQKEQTIQRQLQRLEARVELPWWGTLLLWTFALSGLFLIVGGLIRGVDTAWYIGLIYMLTGVMCGGLTFALKTHFEHGVDQQIQQLQQDLLQIEQSQQQVERTIERLGNLGLPRVDPERTTPEIAALKSSHQLLTELQGLAAQQKKLHTQRQTLSQLRSKLPLYQREANASRQAWCDLLKKIGLDETINMKEAMTIWQKAYEAQKTRTILDQTQRHLLEQKESLKTFRTRIEQLAARLSQGQNAPNAFSNHSALDLLAGWDQQLQRLSGYRLTSESFRTRYKTLRQEFLMTTRHKGKFIRARKRLFARAGVSSREQLEHILKQLERAQLLRQNLSETREELRAISSATPELAITEHDLLHFNENDNRQRITTFKQELKDIDQDQFQLHEQIGQLTQQQKQLLLDRSEVEVRYELAQVEGQIQVGLEEYLATQLAGEGIRELQKKLERTAQSKSLRDASRHFERLSQGKYNNLWSPIGSMELQVDTPKHQSFSVNQLSDGTREQLFLAVRLAMMDEMFRKGIELPVVMDDILVNFDRERSQHAIQSLCEFAQDERQVLFFTCHEHIVDMFAEQGVDIVDLEHLAKDQSQRLAG
jgi:uncharacterized protein YhaN